MTNVHSPFTPPPEAPVFEPTVEEFKDPLAYIAKIRPIAEQSGICKIKPPPDWQPPFAVDVENFKFTPRVQRLNELEATTRIKLNFLDQLAKFSELQGSSLKIPNVERKVLDLFNLHRVVEEEGGMEYVTRERKWSRVATRMGFPAGRSVGAILRQHYERIIYPFEVFQSGTALEEFNIKEECGELGKKDTDYIPHGIPSRQAIKPPADRYGRRSKRCKEEAEAESGDVDYSTNSELKKLQFYGAGPKMPGYSVKSNYEEEEEELKIGSSPKGKKLKVDLIVCHNCGRGDEEACMLLCDGCDDSYHTFCLVPALSEIPKGDWRCPRCVAEEVRKPKEAFGFEQAQREYTLQEFGEMADQFKSDYFNMPVHLVPLSSVEREFWRIVSAVDEDVTVEYGADLHTMDHGSGFPTKDSKDLIAGDEEYMNAGWNLNNLPVLNGSVFRHINADINGMKIPWTYVGMCFATFCWHNEDHWSYSINYLHWGEPKTWYGVPGDKAESFENAMKSAAPELFEAQPDLLHQLVTILNPNVLMDAGVPIVRTNQMAGEFVITFPRSYHSGFNQGYNFAEAVNFAPADWLPVGRVCIAHYSMLHRFCVFSHDELVCKMAADPDRLDISLAASTYQDMLKMVESEKELRKSLLEWGVTEAEREAFELLPDDERQCDHCKTTCFLSAVTCSCNGNKLVCINHKNKLCHCPPEKHCLRYRYTLDELPAMLHRLKVRAESFDNWAVKVKNSLDATDDNKCELMDLKELIQEAEEKRFPKIDLLQTLISAVQEAEKCAAVAQQLLSRKVRTRNRQLGEVKHVAKLTLEDLQLFCQQICSLACEVKETLHIKDLLDRVLEFQGLAREILCEEVADIKKLEKLLDVGLGLDIDVPEIPQLKQKLQQSRWLEEVRHSVSEPHDLTLEMLRKLLDAGVNLPPHPTVEKAMAELQELLTVGERWEEKAKLCLQAKPRHPLSALDVIVGETSDMPVYLPNVLAVKDAVKKAKEWSAKVESIQSGEHYPYLDLLENLVNKGRPIPVRLEQLPQIESQVGAAKSWKERTARTFLKKNSPYTLVEMLSPRKEIGMFMPSKTKKKKVKESDKDLDFSLGWDLVFEEAKDPASIVAAFKTAEQQEIESMRELRIKNLRKRAEDNGDARYCVCRKGLTNYMLQCELCKDWFHANCVPLPKSTNIKKQPHTSSSAALTAHLSKELKFLCPMCLRSRRPRLETILSLLVSLQKLPVRLPEGEALQCLTERAMSWQDRARQALATDELAAALAKLSVLSQRMVEQAAREKTEKIISTELMKAANNPELQPHLQNVAHSAFGGLHGNSLEDKGVISPPLPFGGMSEDMVPSVAAEQEVSLSDPLIMDVETTIETESDSNVTSPPPPGEAKTGEGENPPNYNNMEHAYSSASKTAAGLVPRKHARKSPLVPRQLDSPVLELSDVAKAQLEELMMEGDLLEVSLDETQHIWRILQATKPIRDPLSCIGPFGDLEEMDARQMLFKAEKEKKKIKKRKVLTEDVKIDKSKVKEKNGLKQQPPASMMSTIPSSSMLESSGKPKKKKIKKESDHLNVCSSASSTTSNSSSSSSSSCSSSSSESGKCIIKKQPLKVKIESSALKVRRKALMADKKAVKFNKDRMKQKIMEKRKMMKKPPQNRPPPGGGSGIGLSRPEKKKHGNNSESEEDEGEMCSAGKCLRPTGEAVNWVQCDGGCEKWFHYLCVGLSVNDVSENEDYICHTCTKKADEGIDVQIKVDSLTEAYQDEVMDSQVDVDAIIHVTTDDSSQESCSAVLDTEQAEEVMLQVFQCESKDSCENVPIVDVDELNILSKLEATAS